MNPFSPMSDGPTVLRVLAYALNKDGSLMEPCSTQEVKFNWGIFFTDVNHETSPS